MTTPKMMERKEIEEDASGGEVVDGEDKKNKGIGIGIDKDVYIDSLLQQLRENDAMFAEKDALLAEKDVLLSKANQLDTLAPITEDEGPTTTPPHGLEYELAGSVTAGSVATYDDYLKAQKHLNVKWNNSILSTSMMTSLRSAEEKRMIRAIGNRQGSAWDVHVMSNGVSSDVNQLDEDGPAGTKAEDHNDHGSNKTPWYLPPIQRQRWWEDQSLPHVNWGDLFFDLFYVAAAFNL